MTPTNNLHDLNNDVRQRWDQNAEFWDNAIGPEGNSFQRVLVGPPTERLLNLKPNELVLDIACGSGVFSRRMAQLGAIVVASDFSAKFIERAKAHSSEYADRIEYSVVDATDAHQLLSLGEGRYDAAVCTMALMDMATIEPLMNALPKLLKADGRFVFSLMHPCFNSVPGSRLAVEEEDREGELISTYSVRIVQYHSQKPSKGLGIVGQPTPHYYFPRTLSVLFNTCFQAGFVLDGLEEPVFDGTTSSQRTLSWANFTDIPPALVARLVLR